MKRCPVCGTDYTDEVRFCPSDGQTLRAAAPAADLVGQILADRYHVIKKLGEGGMGQVYLAEHVKMGRRSAIKVMSAAMVHDPDALARFNREAANASRITHANVCAIYDFGETADGMIYLAMEFVPGEPLTDVLERMGPLPVARAVPVFLQTADALQAAHDLGIVHRDLKPDNIMIARGRGGTDLVKVVDFGIAKAVGSDATQKVTKTGLVVGTPEFMSPEQLAGDELDGRSDLYSLALVLFRMLTGKPPFAADTVQETMVKRLTDEPLTLAAARPDLIFPPGLEQCLQTALARSPVDRYQTVAKFADDVAAVTGIAQRAGPALPATRADDDKTQPLDAPVTQAMAARRPTAPAPPAPPAPPGPARRRPAAALVAGTVLLLAAGGGAVLLLGGDGAESAGGTVPGDTGGVAAVPATGDTGETRVAPERNVRRGGDVARPIDAARAQELLDTLFIGRIDANPRLVRDSATVIYNAAGISRPDRAYAAFVIGNAHFKMDDRDTGCRWVRTAVGLDPLSTTFATVARQQCSP